MRESSPVRLCTAPVAARLQHAASEARSQHADIYLERISKRRGQLKPKAKDDESRFRPYCNSSSGEPSIGVRFVAGRHAWTVVLGEDLADEFSAAPHADLVEDRLEVITHGVGRDVQLLGD